MERGRADRRSPNRQLLEFDESGEGVHRVVRHSRAVDQSEASQFFALTQRFDREVCDLRASEPEVLQIRQSDDRCRAFIGEQRTASVETLESLQGGQPCDAGVRDVRGLLKQQHLQSADLANGSETGVRQADLCEVEVDETADALQQPQMVAVDVGAGEAKPAHEHALKESKVGAVELRETGEREPLQAINSAQVLQPGAVNRPLVESQFRQLGNIRADVERIVRAFCAVAQVQDADRVEYPGDPGDGLIGQQVRIPEAELTDVPARRFWRTQPGKPAIVDGGAVQNQVCPVILRQQVEFGVGDLRKGAQMETTVQLSFQQSLSKHFSPRCSVCG